MSAMLSTQQDTAETRTPRIAQNSSGLDQLTLAEWQAFVESHPDSTAFHHRKWIEAIQEQYGWDVYIPCLKSRGEIQAAIPFLAARSLWGRKLLASLPFSDCLRVLSSRPEYAEALTNALMSDPPPCDSMSLRTDTVLANVPCSSHWVRHEVILGRSVEALTEKFKPSIPRNLRRARSAGLRFARRVDAQAMDDFYRLHVRTRQKLGVPVQPKRFFELLWKRVLQQRLGYIGLVLQGAQPVAAAVFLTFNNTVTYKYAASQPDALIDRPNDWLVYNALRLAVEDGYGVFDFGISARKQDGLRRFKRHWGADERDVYTVSLVGREKTPLEESALFKVSTCLIRNSPAIVCRSLGEILYRFAV